MRFFLDNNVPVSVRKMLQDHGHECWTAADAGLADEPQDDNLTVYAARRGAVLISFDREFIQRRQASAIGQHIRLRCDPPEAAAVLAAHLAEVIHFLQREHVTVTVRAGAVKADSDWQ